jgi:hypothetical protein
MTQRVPRIHGLGLLFASLYLSIQIPLRFLEVDERVNAWLASGAADVFDDVTKAEAEVPCLDYAYCLVRIICAAVVRGMIHLLCHSADSTRL